jgi:spore coat polysaccharide biosynthesis predicted glycosyltransferase SpsG
VKNNRREGDTDIGLKQQVLRGVMGGAQEALSQRRAAKASRAINALLQGNDVEQLLDRAKALAQPPGATSSAAQAAPSLTLSQAVEQLRPGGASTSQSHEVIVQIGEDPAPQPA